MARSSCDTRTPEHVRKIVISFKVSEIEKSRLLFAAKCKDQELADFIRDTILPIAAAVGMSKLTGETYEVKKEEEDL